jgi:hypothetical protein
MNLAGINQSINQARASVSFYLFSFTIYIASLCSTKCLGACLVLQLFICRGLSL